MAGNNPHYNYPPPGYPAQGPYQQPAPGQPAPGARHNPYGAYPAGYGGQQGNYQQPAPGAPQNPYGAPPTGFGAQGYPPQMPPPPARFDDEEDKYARMAVDFANQKVRKGFAAKVFSIVLCQLIVTTAITLIFMLVPEVTSYVQQNTWVLWTSYALMIVFMLVIICGGEIRKKWPTNMILLSLFTIVMSVFVACNTVYYTAPEVGMAFGITCGMVLGIVIFALMPCIDFTMCGGVMVALSFTLLFAIIISFFVNIFCGSSCYRTTGLVIASIAVFVFSIYLLYDIQLVMGGKRMAISPDEYIVAALNIYMDIIMIFLYILQIIGLSSR
eukprot:CAMPEP_0177773396 /NCGR_PEP_ID=MMETSP0491_2-20121128/12843_1 /TAXON_ID=63592 /ORGANISM="Tetraselmis chuii, Strain PLY429" /LENGTH=327 /DNA_ID=CAMNT_0019291489 /DNA_START=121 /DNA_END=1104 /DNA_ORIENTATION=-